MLEDDLDFMLHVFPHLTCLSYVIYRLYFNVSRGVVVVPLDIYL